MQSATAGLKRSIRREAKRDTEFLMEKESLIGICRNEWEEALWNREKGRGNGVCKSREDSGMTAVVQNG